MNTFKAVALLVLACFLTACTKDERPVKATLATPVSAVVIAALIICLKHDECNLPTTSEVVGKERIWIMTYEAEGSSLSYFITGTGRICVTSKVSAENQTLYEDLNADGTVDRVTQVISADKRMSYGKESTLYPQAQQIYTEAMKLAEEYFIPSEILGEMKEAEEELRGTKRPDEKFRI